MGYLRNKLWNYEIFIIQTSNGLSTKQSIEHVVHIGRYGLSEKQTI